jgi:flagellar hook assembly protein FlgD
VKQTRLLQNYPNPFNPETWIPYQLATEDDVTVVIYDSGGQLVRTLELGSQPPGLYLTQEKAAYWDGRSDTGEWVSSGTYFYHLQAGSYSAAKKMIILK